MEALITSKLKYLLFKGGMMLKYIWSGRRKWSSSLTTIILFRCKKGER